MCLSVNPFNDHRWNILQEAAIPNGISSPYLLLLSALDQGWKIHPPVRKYDNPIHPEQPSFHVSLERTPARQKRELALPYSLELEKYLTGERIAVRIVR